MRKKLLSVIVSGVLGTTVGSLAFAQSVGVQAPSGNSATIDIDKGAVNISPDIQNSQQIGSGNQSNQQQGTANQAQNTQQSGSQNQNVQQSGSSTSTQEQKKY